jgi:hypothetical protein
MDGQFRVDALVEPGQEVDEGIGVVAADAFGVNPASSRRFRGARRLGERRDRGLDR